MGYGCEEDARTLDFMTSSVPAPPGLELVRDRIGGAIRSLLSGGPGVEPVEIATQRQIASSTFDAKSWNEMVTQRLEVASEEPRGYHRTIEFQHGE